MRITAMDLPFILEIVILNTSYICSCNDNIIDANTKIPLVKPVIVTNTTLCAHDLHNLARSCKDIKAIFAQTDGFDQFGFFYGYVLGRDDVLFKYAYGHIVVTVISSEQKFAIRWTESDVFMVNEYSGSFVVPNMMDAYLDTIAGRPLTGSVVYTLITTSNGDLEITQKDGLDQHNFICIRMGQMICLPYALEMLCAHKNISIYPLKYGCIHKDI
jgi:hypothetical protein